MTIDDVIKFFGSGYSFNKKTKISCNSFYTWKAKGYIPIVSQMKIERLTAGALKANLNHAVKDDIG